MAIFAVIRIRGRKDVRHDVKKTLELLRLTRKNHCVLVPANPFYTGMLKRAKDRITWGEIDEKTLEKLVRGRGRLPGRKKIADKDVSSILKKILAGKIKETSIKPVFRLNPPRKGFERGGVRKTFAQGGVLGYRGKAVNKLLERMI